MIFDINLEGMCFHCGKYPVPIVLVQSEGGEAAQICRECMKKATIAITQKEIENKCKVITYGKETLA